MELIVYNANEQQIKPIQWNKDVIEEKVKALLEPFKNQLFTDQTIPEAKEARAKLNGLSKQLNAWRIEQTRDFLAPVEQFKSEVDEVKNLIDEASKRIDGVVKDYQTREQEEKKQLIEKIYSKVFYGYITLVPLDKIFNQKWLNKAYTEKLIEKELTAILDKIVEDVTVIDTTFSDKDERLEIKTEYFKSLNLAVTLSEYNRSKEYKQHLQEQAKAEEERKAQAQAEKQPTRHETQATEQVAEEEKEQPKTVTLSANGDILTKPKTYEMSFRITATKEQLLALREFFENNDIQYEKI